MALSNRLTIWAGVSTSLAPKDKFVAIVSMHDDGESDSSERINFRDFLALANSASEMLTDLRAATTSSRACKEMLGSVAWVLLTTYDFNVEKQFVNPVVISSLQNS